MSSSSRFRMHMGCGEPLKSRKWIVNPARRVALARQEAGQKINHSRRSAAKKGVKCKS